MRLIRIRFDVDENEYEVEKLRYDRGWKLVARVPSKSYLKFVQLLGYPEILGHATKWRYCLVKTK
jgi:hypothetical protein